MPAHLLGFGLFFAVDEDLHPVVVQAVRFYQVHNVELVHLVLTGVRYTEIEPLSKLLGRAMIIL